MGFPTSVLAALGGEGERFRGHRNRSKLAELTRTVQGTCSLTTIPG